MRLITITIVSLLVSVLVGTASAQSDYTHFYKLYEQSLSQGDKKAAGEYLSQSFLTARKNGANPEAEAALAQLTAGYFILSDPARALGPADRAVELAKKGVGLENVSLGEQIIIREAAFYYADTEYRSVEDFYAVLVEHQEALQHPSTRLLRLMIKTTADLHLLEMYDETEWLGARTIAVLKQLSPVADEQIKAVNLLRVSARVNSGLFKKRKRQEILETRAIVDYTIGLYPVQSDIETYDDNLAILMAFGSLLELYQEQLGLDPKESIAFEGYTLHQNFSNPNPTAHCRVEWLKREAPDYPRKAAYKGLIGVIIVGYDLNPDGTTSRMRYLAELPAELFAQESSKAVATWRADPASIAPGCYNNHVTTIKYRLTR